MTLPKKLDTLRSALGSLRARLALGRAARAALLDALRSASEEIQSLRQENAAMKAARPADDAGESALLDEFYLSFENRYRGSPQEVREKTSFYLGELEALELDKATAVVLDLGCGRGEWLELLREAGYRRACGVDASPRMVEACRERDLHAALGDAIERLELADESSVSAITGYHIAEHLPFPALVRLLKAARRALKPGCVAIFETPNPRNFAVGGNTFYFDPTHVRPIPVELFACVGEFVGLQVKAIHQRSPHPHLAQVADAAPEGALLFKNMLSCGLDYGIVFQRPA